MAQKSTCTFTRLSLDLHCARVGTEQHKLGIYDMQYTQRAKVHKNIIFYTRRLVGQTACIMIGDVERRERGCIDSIASDAVAHSNKRFWLELPGYKGKKASVKTFDC
eukprot:1060815-Pelagomonas_calceolata.AAC.1